MQVIISYELLEKTTNFKSPLPPKLVEEFKQLSSLDKDVGRSNDQLLNQLPRQGFDDAYFDKPMMELMARVERRAGKGKIIPVFIIEDILADMRKS